MIAEQLMDILDIPETGSDRNDAESACMFFFLLLLSHFSGEASSK
jgi:hypothetical protein